MIAAALALLGVVGAWLAWKRNPLYSAASTWRMLAVVGFSIAALVLLIVAAVNLTAKSSGPVVVATMLSVVVLGTFAMIYIIQKLSIPKEARLITALPAGTKLVH